MRTRLPDLTLEALRSGLQIPLQRLGRPALYILHGHKTSSASGRVNAPARRAQPDVDRLLVASLVDLSSIPRLLRKMAGPVMSRACDDARAALRPGLDPDQYVVILVDGKGEVAKALGLRSPNAEACVILADSEGWVIDLYQGPRLAANALRLIEEAGLAASSD